MDAACFPRLYAAASLKLGYFCDDVGFTGPFSAALCRGLIEACTSVELRHRRSNRFPRLYAAASLKRNSRCWSGHIPKRFSAALCRGLIEAALARWLGAPYLRCFPRLYAAASLKPKLRASRARSAGSFPRLYAAASLKRELATIEFAARSAFSAALCRGLIEAKAAAANRRQPTNVFRGFMPRPH